MARQHYCTLVLGEAEYQTAVNGGRVKGSIGAELLGASSYTFNFNAYSRRPAVSGTKITRTNNGSMTVSPMRLSFSLSVDRTEAGATDKVVRELNEAINYFQNLKEDE